MRMRKRKRNETWTRGKRRTRRGGRGTVLGERVLYSVIRIRRRKKRQRMGEEEEEESSEIHRKTNPTKPLIPN